jgi:hypothetical protein
VCSLGTGERQITPPQEAKRAALLKSGSAGHPLRGPAPSVPLTTLLSTRRGPCGPQPGVATVCPLGGAVPYIVFSKVSARRIQLRALNRSGCRNGACSWGRARPPAAPTHREKRRALCKGFPRFPGGASLAFRRRGTGDGRVFPTLRLTRARHLRGPTPAGRTGPLEDELVPRAGVQVRLWSAADARR